MGLYTVVAQLELRYTSQREGTPRDRPRQGRCQIPPSQDD